MFKRITQDSLKLCSSFYYSEKHWAKRLQINRRVFKMGRKSKELSEDRKQLVVDLKREGHRNCEITTKNIGDNINSQNRSQSFSYFREYL
jgi:hypothetical protein